MRIPLRCPVKRNGADHHEWRVIILNEESGGRRLEFFCTYCAIRAATFELSEWYEDLLGPARPAE